MGLVISTKNRPENSGRQKGLAIRFRTLLSGELLTQFGFKHALTHTQALRGDLQQLIVVDELQALFQRQVRMEVSFMAVSAPAALRMEVRCF